MAVAKSVVRWSVAFTMITGLIGGQLAAAQTSAYAERAARVQEMRANMPTQAQREAAAAERAAFKAKVELAKKQALKAGATRPASAQLPPDVGPIGPGSVPDYYTTSNWAFSPPLRKFIDTLPGLTFAGRNNREKYIPVAVPDTVTYPGSDYYEISARQYQQSFHTDLPETTLRGYVQTNKGTDSFGENTVAPSPIFYLGPIIVAQRDRPVRIKFTNELPIGPLGDLPLPVDTTIQGSGPGPLWPASKYGQPNPAGGPAIDENTPCDASPTASVPPGNATPGPECASYTQNRVAIHLHGGRTPWISDGTPHQWIIPAGEWANTPYKEGVSLENVPDMPNPGAGSTTYYYSNQQSARLMFYHDHAWGITRLNVMEGVAAGYLITDDFEAELVGTAQNPGPVPADQIPLVIQDRTFVAPDVRENDPTWNWGTGAMGPGGVREIHVGDLWIPHVYMPAQNPYDTTGVNPFGRWVYGPWFFPPTTNIMWNTKPNPYHDPACSDPDPAVYAFCTTPGQGVMIPGTPSPSVGAETFLDTAVVNGQAFPSLTVEPKAYRFRILNAANDRFWNLNLYKADPAQVSHDNRTLTEVKMVTADGKWNTALYPGWPADGRPEGVPDPTTQGPPFIQIGTEGGFLPRPVVVPAQPITFVADPTAFNVGNVKDFGLFLGPAERADVIVDFSDYPGQTFILYNDAPAAVPAFDPRHDFLTGAPDLSDTGGYGRPPPWDNTLPKAGPQIGYGPNTRTIMQIKVANTTPAATYDLAALERAFAPDPATSKLGVFERGQEPIIVGQDAYNGAYTGVTFPKVWPYWGFSRIDDESLPVFTVGGQHVTFPMEPKGMHDEMGASFDMEFGRMSANLGITNTQRVVGLLNLTIYKFHDPSTEILSDAVTSSINPTLGDGTQIWKISHNGVDTHPIHFHIFDVQVLNRVGWDGQIRPPHPTELGWKDTVRISPLEDTIVAMRPWAPKLPFGVPDSLRLLNPALPLNATYGFTNIDPITQQPKAVPDVNRVDKFGWEYVWHCHILSHEENDMMRPIVLNVVSAVPGSPSPLAIDDSGASPVLTWSDLTPVDYGSQAFFGDPSNEIAFRVERTADVGGGVTTIYVPANRTTFTDTSATPGVYYRYRVVAYNEAGEAASNFVEIRTPTPSTQADSVTLSANPASGFVQILPGTPVVFTAQGVGGSGAYEYRFSVDGVMKQDYSPVATYTLPITTVPGTYAVKVDVRTSAAAALPDASNTLNYVWAVPATAGLTLGAVPGTSPVLFGTAVVFTATGTGSTGYQYRFWVDSGSGYGATPVQDWSPTLNTWTLPSTSAPATYKVKAEVRTTASVIDASQELTTVVQYRPATALSLRASAAGPYQLSNPPATVTFLALGGGSAGTPALGYQYRFSLSSDGGSTYTVKQGFGTNKLWTMPSSTPPGAYTLKAEVTTNPAGGVADKTATMTFTVLAGAAAATDLTLQAAPASPQYAGTPVLFTAAASGGTPTYYYRFLLSSDGVNYNEVQASSLTATWTMPDTTAAGSYTVKAEVKTNPFAATPDRTVTLPYQLLASAPATDLQLFANVPSPQLVGTTVVLTASATGGGPAYYYRFWKSTDDGLTWTTLRDWSPLATYTIDTSVGGKFKFMADVRTTTSGGRQLSATLEFQLKYPVATGVTLTPSVASPAIQGANVVLTAAGSSTVGGLTYYYRFWRSTNGGSTWTMLRNYSTTATYTIPTDTIGTSSYMVDAQTNLGGAREATKTITYTVNPPPPTSITLDTNVTSPRTVGTSVVFTATASSNVAGLTFEYRFWLSTDGGVTYTVKQGYGLSNTYNMPTGTAGSFRVMADARTVGSNVGRSVTISKPFVITNP